MRKRTTKEGAAETTAQRAGKVREQPAAGTVSRKPAGKKSTGKKSTGKKSTVRKAAGKTPGAKRTAAAPRKPGFGRESLGAKRARTAEVVRRLKQEYPDAKCSLDHEDPYQLLVATILSAQCTDERVNQVTPALFRRYPTAEDLAGAESGELEELIRSTGFFRNKARSLLGMATAVTEQHAGRVPDGMAALTALPGVGRKTANVVIGNAFGRNEGVVVDTHVTRLSQRLGFTREQDAVAIEQDLVKLVARTDWTLFSHLLIYHGRAVCKAPTPRCEHCVLAEICPSSRV